MTSPPFDPGAVRYHPLERRGHVESYFLKLADAAGERAIWIKATIFASTVEPDRVIAEGWAIAFDRRGGASRIEVVKHEIPCAGASFGRRGLDVRWRIPDRASALPDAMIMTDREASGRVSRRDQAIAWDLRITALAPPIIPFPQALYTAPIPRTKSCTPAPDARFDGEVTAFGERWEIAGWRGVQGHNWGRAHAERYVWCHLVGGDPGEPFILEGMSGDLRLGKLPLPRATVLCVRDRGEAYDFNRPLDLLRTKSDIGLRRWEFAAESARARVEGTIEAPTADFVGLHYPNPDGSMLHCLNASLAHARIRFHASGKPARTITSNAAALEIGSPDADHGVKMYL